MITLTSFWEGRARKVHPISAARWAPDFAKGWDTAEWAKPQRPDGTAIKLRDFGEDPIPAYTEYMMQLYRDRWPAIKAWLGEYSEDVALCCWCPRTATAKRQIEQFGTFHCHLYTVSLVLRGAEQDWRFGTAHSEGMVR